MKHLLLASLITLLAFGTACGQASEPEPVANNGIQVHGDWTVTVTNPDGTVDAVHEFENTLAFEGLLTALISGSNNVDYHAIKVHSNPGGLAPITPFTCVEDFSGMPESSLISFIEANVIVEESEYPPLVLTATCTVKPLAKGFNSQLVQVATVLYDADKCITIFLGSNQGMGCSSWPSEHNLNGSQGMAVLTFHNMNPPMDVFEGQILAFNIRITFS